MEKDNVSSRDKVIKRIVDANDYFDERDVPFYMEVYKIKIHIRATSKARKWQAL